MSFLKGIFNGKANSKDTENEFNKKEVNYDKNATEEKNSEVISQQAVEELKENFVEENKLVIEVSKGTRKMEQDIEKILYENDLDKLKYFIRRFFLENTGNEPTLIIENGKINVDFGIFKSKIQISEIVLNLIRESNFSFDRIDYSEVLKGKFFAFKFSSYNFLNFDLIPLEPVDENFLKELKNILEKYFLPYLENANEYKLSEEEISKILELESKDKLTYTDDKLNLLLAIKKFDNFDKDSIMLIANSIASLGDYFVRGREFLLSVELDVYEEKNNGLYSITLSRKDNGLLISIKPQKYKIKITRKFLQNFVKSLVLSIKELSNQEENLIEELKKLGVKVEKHSQNNNLEKLFEEKGFVGYEDIKEQIVTHVINPWKNKEKYEKFVKENLPNIKNIVPNAVLFHGVPGTGKTTMASIIGEYLGYPFVYIPVNSIMSKWFGESENRLNDILETCGKLAKKEGGVVIMIDEIDEIGKNREKTSSDASNRILGVLLKKLDGLEKLDNILLIGGTNLPDSLDPALLSRFSQQIEFRLPKEKEIVAILKYYLPILEEDGLEMVAKNLKGKSGRNIKKLSEDFARYLIKEDIKENYLQEFEKFISFLDKNATNYPS